MRQAAAAIAAKNRGKEVLVSVEILDRERFTVDAPAPYIVAVADDSGKYSQRSRFGMPYGGNPGK
jgi:hypothetical protein